ncbi:MAG TPA: murein biosynthesis integral membrane protein MurJ [Alphaproteobacteria bacterium]
MLRSIATVGGWTMASRVLGFVRDILIARVLGAGLEADAFFVAFRFPNLFRRLFAEGAFNAAFVPLYARALTERGPVLAARFAEETLALLLTVLLAVTFLAELAMPWLMAVIAPGFIGDEVKYGLAVQFTRITFPYLLLMALAALYSGVLNAHRRYAHAAAAPILLNLAMIAAMAVATPLWGEAGLALSWAVTLAGIGQFLWMHSAAAQAEAALRLPARPVLTPEIRRLLKLMVPGVIGSGAMQINLLIGTMIASLAPGAVSYLYYADRIYQLPLGVIGSAIGVVLLPEITRRLRSGQEGAAGESLNRAIELGLLITLPAAVALIAIPEEIIGALFERGAFGREATRATAAALAGFALGLPAFVLIKALAPAFYAREDTATPFRYAIAAMIANTVLSLAFFPVLGFVGIAIATSLASWLNFALLWIRLARSGFLTIDVRLRRRAPRILLVSCAMGAALLAAAAGLEDASAGPPLARASALALLVAGGGALYFALALASGAIERSALRALIRRGARAP